MGAKLADAGPRKENAHDGSADSEQQTLQKELAHKSGAAGTQSRANCEFPSPRRGTSEQQACDVGAANQQQEPDRRKQDKERPPKPIADHRMDERFDADAEVRRIILAIRRRDTRANEIHVGFRFLK